MIHRIIEDGDSMKFPLKAYHCQFQDGPVTLIGAVSASKARAQYFRESGLDDIYDFGDAIIGIRVRRAKNLDQDLMEQAQIMLDCINRNYGTSFKVGDQCMANNVPGIITGCIRHYIEVMHGEKRYPYHPSDVIPIAGEGAAV